MLGFEANPISEQNEASKRSPSSSEKIITQHKVNDRCEIFRGGDRFVGHRRVALSPKRSLHGSHLFNLRIKVCLLISACPGCSTVVLVMSFCSSISSLGLWASGANFDSPMLELEWMSRGLAFPLQVAASNRQCKCAPLLPTLPLYRDARLLGQSKPAHRLRP